MNLPKEVIPVAVSGQIIDPVVISASELANLRQARAMFDELRDVLSNAVIPAIGGRYHSVSVRVETLLGEIHLRSGGFLARHWREPDQDHRPVQVLFHPVQASVVTPPGRQPDG